MKTKSMQVGRWAAALLLCLLALPATLCSQEVAPCNPAWYETPWPPGDWGEGPQNLRESLPNHYYDFENVGAAFLVPLEGLQSLLPQGVRALGADAEHSPWKGFGSQVAGFGVLQIGVGDYHSLQYGPPYKEYFANVMVSDEVSWSHGLIAWFPIAMVLTDVVPTWCGVTGWGFPKIVGDAHLQAVKPHGFKAFASVDNELIMKLEVAADDFTPAPAARIMMLTTKEGYLVRTAWVATGSAYFSPSVGKSTLKLGNHPLAQQLRAIGVGEYVSIGQFRGEHLQAEIDVGTCEPLP